MITTAKKYDTKQTTKGVIQLKEGSDSSSKKAREQQRWPQQHDLLTLPPHNVTKETSLAV